MPDPVWYYARGETEKGPLSSAQIKALAAAGKIRADDYVWKEGMENWLPAGDVKELFPADATKSKEGDASGGKSAEKSTAVAKPERSRQKREATGIVVGTQVAEPQQLMQLVCRFSLLVGVLAVVLARGCDSVSARYVDRFEAIATSAENRFQAEWDQQRRALQQKEEELRARQRSPSDEAELRNLTNQLSQLDNKMESEKARLQASKWRDLKNDAVRASEDNLKWGFWREILFQMGLALLAFGLVGVAYSTDGPERWICLIVLAVVVYSILIGGQAARI